MAEKQVKVFTSQCFPDDDYGWIESFQDKTIRADVAERWIAEGKATLVPVERAVIETPEDNLIEHETADLKKKSEWPFS